MNGNKTVVKNYGGTGFTSLLTLLFIALKLTGYISWSWWWVLSPIWIFLLLIVAVFALILFFAIMEDRRR